MAVSDMNGVEIELIKPLDDQSVYDDFLAENDEGIQHLCFNTDNIPFDELNSYLQSRYGDPVFNGLGARTRFAYYDCRKDMGIFMEVVTLKDQQ